MTGKVTRYTDTMRCVVEVPEDLKGRVVGRGGRQLKAIESETGVKMKMVPSGAVLEGSEEAIEKAKEMIQSIIKSSTCSHISNKTIHFPLEYYGIVIGRNGVIIKSIQSQTNTKIRLENGSDTGLAHISGATEEDCNEAERKILEIVSRSSTCSDISKKTIRFPLEYYGMVIGTNGVMIKSIKRQTNTKIRLENGSDTGLAHISGATEEDCNEAERKILEIVSRPLCRKFAFVDGACVGEDNDFGLEICEDDYKPKYKLIMQGDKLLEHKEVDYLPLVEKSLLEVLHEIHKENEESKNLRTDMWCHFGHAYICNVDEDDVGQFYEIEAVNENLQREEDMWIAFFKEGLETLELNELEGVLSKRPYKVQPNMRFDYTFSCPSGRQVRFKAFGLQSSSYPDGISFQKSLIPMKNVLADLSTESIEYYLCAPSTVRLKVDIIIPYLKLDCHLVVRTTLKETSSVRDEEEDQILIDFLNDNLSLREEKLELHGDLPDGFIITYKRVCKRRTYPYTSNNVDFNVTISEEESQELMTEKSVRTKTDIHLHCDEWDQLLDQEDWEPEAIVSKLPDFLHFVRDVQNNINPVNDE